MAQEDNTDCSSEKKSGLPINRFEPLRNSSNETLGDYAFDKFQEWAQATWNFEGWREGDRALAPDVVEAETKCLLDIPYLWLRYGTALEVVAAFEDWLVAVMACIEDMLWNPNYQWILKTTDARQLRMVAACEGWNHPALQRANFERIKIETQCRRDRELREYISDRLPR